MGSTSRTYGRVYELVPVTDVTFLLGTFVTLFFESWITKFGINVRVSWHCAPTHGWTFYLRFFRSPDTRCISPLVPECSSTLTFPDERSNYSFKQALWLELFCMVMKNNPGTFSRKKFENNLGTKMISVKSAFVLWRQGFRRTQYVVLVIRKAFRQGACRTKQAACMTVCSY